MGRRRLWGLAAMAMLGGQGCNEVLGWDLPAAGLPLSCADIELSCGAGESEGNCCAMSMVFGSVSKDVSGIFLDKYEVTVGRFRTFLDAESRSNDFSGCDATWGNGDVRLPVNCINWQDAHDFCVWDHGRLPTLEELKFAASPNPETKKFPWGDLFLGNEAVVGAAFSRPEAVGSKYNGKTSGEWEIYDLVGNVAEWTTKPLADGESAPSSQACFGGSFTTDPTILNDAMPPDDIMPIDARSAGIGFRCARDR